MELHALGVCGYEVCAACMAKMKAKTSTGRIMCPACRDPVFWTTTPVQGLPGRRVFFFGGILLSEVPAYVVQLRRQRIAEDAALRKYTLTAFEAFLEALPQKDVLHASTTFLCLFDPMPTDVGVLTEGLRVVHRCATRCCSTYPKQAPAGLRSVLLRILNANTGSTELIVPVLDILQVCGDVVFRQKDAFAAEALATVLALVVDSQITNVYIVEKVVRQLASMPGEHCLPMGAAFALWATVDTPSMPTSVKCDAFKVCKKRMFTTDWLASDQSRKKEVVLFLSRFCLVKDIPWDFRWVVLEILQHLALTPAFSDLCWEHLLLWRAQVTHSFGSDSAVTAARFFRFVGRLLKKSPKSLAVDTGLVAKCLAEVLTENPNVSTTEFRKFAKCVHALVTFMWKRRAISIEATRAVFQQVAEQCIPPMLMVWRTRTSKPEVSVPCIKALHAFLATLSAPTPQLPLIQACTPLVLNAMGDIPLPGVGEKLRDSAPLLGLQLLGVLVQLEFPRAVIVDVGVPVLVSVLGAWKQWFGDFLPAAVAVVHGLCGSKTLAAHAAVLDLVRPLWGAIRLAESIFPPPKVPSDFQRALSMWVQSFLQILDSLVSIVFQHKDFAPPSPSEGFARLSTLSEQRYVCILDALCTNPAQCAGAGAGAGAASAAAPAPAPSPEPGPVPALASYGMAIYVKHVPRVAKIVAEIQPFTALGLTVAEPVRVWARLLFACSSHADTERCARSSTRMVLWWMGAHLVAPDDGYVLWGLLRALDGSLEAIAHTMTEPDGDEDEAKALFVTTCRVLDEGPLIRVMNDALGSSLAGPCSQHVNLRRTLYIFAILIRVGIFPGLQLARTVVVSLMGIHRDDPHVVTACLRCFPYSKDFNPDLLVDVQPADVLGVLDVFEDMLNSTNGFKGRKLGDFEIGAVLTLLEWCAQNGLLRDVRKQAKGLILTAIETNAIPEVAIRGVQILRALRSGADAGACGTQPAPVHEGVVQDLHHPHDCKCGCDTGIRDRPVSTSTPTPAPPPKTDSGVDPDDERSPNPHKRIRAE
jgi:hypothetical protein